jgi:hypothetical protein
MEVQPGYWDYERCAWVGSEPTYLFPSARSAGDIHGLHVHAAAVPSQSRTSELEATDADPEVTATTPV